MAWTLGVRWRRLSRPELAVFVSGVASMGLEIFAGRMLAPQFGSSIYTWGSIIGVFLAALSYGYYRGGARAADAASIDRMARLFVYTAVYIAGLVFAGEVLLDGLAALPVPPRFASLPAIVVLFGPPTYLLGFISPYAAELSDGNGPGRISGNVYAIGTVGSIIGAFLTTFVLIPSLDMTVVGGLLGGIVVVTAAVLVCGNGASRQAGAVAVAGLLLVAAVGSGAAGISAEGRVVYQTQTAYQDLRVVDLGDTRTLYLDGQRHSAMDLDDPDRHVFTYTRYFHLPFLFTDDIDRVLFIGGGGFTGPKRFLTEYNVTVDVVEIDPEVVRVAKRYFAVPQSQRLNVHTMDGRRFLQQTNRTYDLIVLDAFRRDKVPFQLTTVEFFRLVKGRLSSDGILFANLISAPTGPASRFYRAEFKTMARVFPQVYSFPTAGGASIQNIELIATKNSTRLNRRELLARNDRRDVGLNLTAEIRSLRQPPPTSGVPMLRDDRAPVDRLLNPLVGQRYVIEKTNHTAVAPAARRSSHP